MIKKSFFLLLLQFIFLPTIIEAARIDTLRVHSASMNKEIATLIIVPTPASEQDAGAVYPVLYLLHGHGGNESNWLGVRPDLGTLADKYGLYIVCPDAQNSWYWDSPVQLESKYETFISIELPAYIDAHYATVPSRLGRAITGFSMGGHGALWNALRHPEVFGVAGSTSGGVDIRPFSDNWNLKELLGSYEEFPTHWENHTVINLIEGFSEKMCVPTLIIDCGMDDFFLEVNQALHHKLVEKGIRHDFILRPGAHDGAYWANSIEYQLLFFHLFFSSHLPTTKV